MSLQLIEYEISRFRDIFIALESDTWCHVKIHPLHARLCIYEEIAKAYRSGNNRITLNLEDLGAVAAWDIDTVFREVTEKTGIVFTKHKNEIINIPLFWYWTAEL